MVLPVTNWGDNPAYPYIRSDTYLPDQLIAGDLKEVTSPITVLTGAGAVYARGTVMGLITASGKYTISKTGAADGSQNPVAILADNVDASAADATGGVYLMGEFNANAVTLDASYTLATVAPLLQAHGIFLKTPISAADPL